MVLCCAFVPLAQVDRASATIQAGLPVFCDTNRDNVIDALVPQLYDSDPSTTATVGQRSQTMCAVELPLDFTPVSYSIVTAATAPPACAPAGVQVLLNDADPVGDSNPFLDRNSYFVGRQMGSTGTVVNPAAPPALWFAYHWLILAIDPLDAQTCDASQLAEISVAGTGPTYSSDGASPVVADWSTEPAALTADDSGAAFTDAVNADATTFTDVPDTQPVIDFNDQTNAEATAASLLGDRFAGIEAIDSENTIYVYAVGTTTSDSGLGDLIQRGMTRTRIVLVDGQLYNWSTLVAAQGQFADLLNSGSQELLSEVVGSSIDREQNRVVELVQGTASDLSPLLAVASQTAVPGAIVFRQLDAGTKQVTQAAENYESYPPAEAGKRIRASKYGTCSSGYVFEDRRYQSFYWSTAGHCGDPGAAFRTGYSNSIVVGHIARKIFGRTDVGLVPIPSQNASNHIYAGNGSYVSVIGTYPSKFFSSAGRLVYVRGERSGGHGGRVMASTTYPDTETEEFTDPSTGAKVLKEVQNLFCTNDTKTQAGDSGGPAWVDLSGGRYAAGLVSATIVIDYYDSNGNFVKESEQGTCIAGLDAMLSNLGSTYQVWVTS